MIVEMKNRAVNNLDSPIPSHRDTHLHVYSNSIQAGHTGMFVVLRKVRIPFEIIPVLNTKFSHLMGKDQDLGTSLIFSRLIVALR